MAQDVVLTDRWQDSVKFDAHGLIPAIAQDHQNQRILMVAWMNAQALEETVMTGWATYFSRSRAKLWRKGEESGHRQKVHAIRLDCDGDVILLHVEPHGGIACHTGRESCFFYDLQSDASGHRHWVVTEDTLPQP